RAVDGERGWYCEGVDDGAGTVTYPSCSRGDAQSIYSGTGGVANILFNGTGGNSLGLPENVKANIYDPKPGAIGTLGMYFGENHNWAVEAPVMALPFEIDVYGAGSFQNAGKIMTGKTLGFLVFGHYYFGQKADKFRPSVSL